MKQWFSINRIGILKIAIVLLIIAILCALLYQPFVALLSDPSTFRQWLNQYGFFSYLIFSLINMAQIMLAFLPGEIVEVLAGYCFGLINGMLVCMIASGVASALIFLAIRHFHIDLLSLFFNDEATHQFRFLFDSRHLSIILFIIFLIPGTPKDILTYIMPLTKIRFTAFLMITTVARIPSIITSTMVGDALFSNDYMTSLIIYGITALLSGAGLYLYNRYIGTKEVRA